MDCTPMIRQIGSGGSGCKCSIGGKFGIICSNGSKGNKMSQLVCFCFEYTAEDIISDCKVNNGESSILTRITEAKKKAALVIVTTNTRKRGDALQMSAV